MRCFKCNSPTVTIYWHHGEIMRFNPLVNDAGKQITHVNKACTVCEWMSYRMKLPSKLD